MVRLYDPELSSTKCGISQKRQRPDEHPSEDQVHQTKKPKFYHPLTPPSRFWDNLTQPVLTKNALRELDRRFRAEAVPHCQTNCDHCLRGDFSSERSRLRQSSLADRVQLKRFARHGGPDLEDLRGVKGHIFLVLPIANMDQCRPSANSNMSASQSTLGRRKRGSRSPTKSDATPNTTTTRSTGPYDRAFQQHLIDHDIFPPDYEYPNGDELPEPENMDEIRRRLEEPRASLSPRRFSKDDFKKFKRADAHATKESRVIASVIPIIEGDTGDLRCVASDIPFTNLDHLTDGSLVCAKPDLYYGARPEQLSKQLRETLGNLIVPSTQDDLPILPNNFLEVKGPDGSLSVATRQALYNVTLGSRGFSSLQSYDTTRPLVDNKAHALAWTYHGGTLKAYTSHTFQPSVPGSRNHYSMTPLDSWCLTGNQESFRRGATAFRNGKEWSKSERDRAITEANEKAVNREIITQKDGSRFVAEERLGGTVEKTQRDSSLTVCYDPDTSEDELSLSFERPSKRSRSPLKKSVTIEPPTLPQRIGIDLKAVKGG